jgi:hypothetical protein
MMNHFCIKGCFFCNETNKITKMSVGHVNHGCNGEDRLAWWFVLLFFHYNFHFIIKWTYKFILWPLLVMNFICKIPLFLSKMSLLDIQIISNMHKVNKYKQIIWLQCLKMKKIRHNTLINYWPHCLLTNFMNSHYLPPHN